MSGKDDDEMRLILPAALPQAWNIGLIQEAGPIQSMPPRRVEAHVFAPGSMEVRCLTGQKCGGVIIQIDGEAVAVLYPNQVAEIIKHWLRP